MAATGRRVWLALAGVLVVGLAVTVVWVVRDGDEDDDRQDGAESPPISGPLEVSPDRLGRGEEFTVTSTDERVVEGGFSLAVWDGVGWTYQYQLLGSEGSVEDGAQRWRTWSERTSYVPDVVLGSKPVLLVVPSNAIAGDYRLCVESPEPPVCAGLTVAD